MIGYIIVDYYFQMSPPVYIIVHTHPRLNSFIQREDAPCFFCFLFLEIKNKLLLRFLKALDVSLTLHK